MASTLRTRLIRLASMNVGLRPHLLSILKGAAHGSPDIGVMESALDDILEEHEELLSRAQGFGLKLGAVPPSTMPWAEAQQVLSSFDASVKSLEEYLKKFEMPPETSPVRKEAEALLHKAQRALRKFQTDKKRAELASKRFQKEIMGGGLTDLVDALSGHLQRSMVLGSKVSRTEPVLMSGGGEPCMTSTLSTGFYEDPTSSFSVSLEAKACLTSMCVHVLVNRSNWSQFGSGTKVTPHDLGTVCLTGSRTADLIRDVTLRLKSFMDKQNMLVISDPTEGVDFTALGGELRRVRVKIEVKSPTKADIVQYSPGRYSYDPGVWAPWGYIEKTPQGWLLLYGASWDSWRRPVTVTSNIDIIKHIEGKLKEKRDDDARSSFGGN